MTEKYTDMNITTEDVAHEKLNGDEDRESNESNYHTDNAIKQHKEHVIKPNSTFDLAQSDKYRNVMRMSCQIRMTMVHDIVRICTRIWRVFLAHLSQRLIGELIGYSWSGVRPSSVVVRPS